MPSRDEELLARFNQRFAAIETEIPSPMEMGLAGSPTQPGRRRSSAPAWIGASVVAAALVTLAVIGIRVWGPLGPSPSAPAVGHTVVPSTGVQVSSPGESLTPTPLASPDVSAPPPTTPTLAPPPSPSSTPPPTAAPSPTTSASVPVQTSTPEPVGWIGPELIATDHYEEVSVAVDQAGHAHVAAVAGHPRLFGDGIFYLTNATGTWTRERLTTPVPEGYDGQPSIVIRDDGSLAIAFARFGGLQCAFGCNPVDPQGIFLLTNRSGSWSDALPIIEGMVLEPSLQATEGGLHLAYSRGGDEDRTVEYASAEDGVDTWSTAVVGEGRSPSLRIGRDGLARIAYYLRPYGIRSLFFAAQIVSGEFVTERVPGDWVADTTGSPPLLALDPTDQPQIVFFSETEDEPQCGTLSVRRTAGSWSDPSVVFPEDEFCQLEAAAIDTDIDGTLHVISIYNITNMGIWYANDAGGEFQARQLRDLGGRSISDVPHGDSGIAVDAGGRPHVLYVVRLAEQRNDNGLWYGIGPGG